MTVIPSQKLKDNLVTRNLIAPDEFDALLTEAQRMGQNISDVLVSRGFITQEYFSSVLADYLGVERADLKTRGIKRDALLAIDEKFAREKQLVAFAKDAQGVLEVAMQDPSDLLTVEFLEKKLGEKIRPYLATPDDLSLGFSFYGRQLTEDFKKVIEEKVRASIEAAASAETEEEAAMQLPIVEVVNSLLSYASSLRASDIHWEIIEEGVLVRFRVDGILREMMRIPREVHMPVIARIKLLGGMKIDEHYKSQDGRFRFVIGQQATDIRVSIIPTLYGEKIVLRLLEATQRPLSLAELGMLDDTVKIVEENIKKTFGMVLITGPTGSGKTTTLYAVLNLLNSPEVNIVTIEDPVEYNIRYINQIQINPVAGITFASGLRSILRQDPNIIMVGEVRDEETADIAVNAALTGHLLFSTLHTNDAPTAVPRLIDMKIPPFLVAAVLNVVLAQRLVRRICMDCIESYEISISVVMLVKRQMQELGIPDTEIPRRLYRGRGCKSCGNSGYHGRVAIFEALEVGEEIRAMIINPAFSLDSLIAAARKNGMVSMFEDGVRKTSLGLTTLEEVLRVIRE